MQFTALLGTCVTQRRPGRRLVTAHSHCGFWTHPYDEVAKCVLVPLQRQSIPRPVCVDLPRNAQAPHALDVLLWPHAQARHQLQASV